MVHVGQELTGSGNYLRFIRTAAETDGELLEMESTYREGAAMPAAHFHPAQDEHFEVLEGTVRTIIDGVEGSHAAGETFHVPAGAVHHMVGEAGTRLNWQVRPALRTAEFFEGLSGEADLSGESIEERYEVELLATPRGRAPRVRLLRDWRSGVDRRGRPG